MNEKIKIRFNYIPADIIDAIKLYDSVTPMHYITKGAAVVSLVTSAMCAYGYFQLNRYYGATYGTGWFALIFLLLAVEFWFDPIRPLLARLVFGMNAKIYSDPAEVTFDEEGVHAKTSTYELKRVWTAYMKFLESERLFMLVYGKRLYATFPKRAFADEQEIDAFREFVMKKIGNLKYALH